MGARDDYLWGALVVSAALAPFAPVTPVVSLSDMLILGMIYPRRYQPFAIFFADPGDFEQSLTIGRSSASCVRLEPYLVTYNYCCTSALGRSVGERARLGKYYYQAWAKTGRSPRRSTLPVLRLTSTIETVRAHGPHQQSASRRRQLRVLS